MIEGEHLVTPMGGTAGAPNATAAKPGRKQKAQKVAKVAKVQIDSEDPAVILKAKTASVLQIIPYKYIIKLCHINTSLIQMFRLTRFI